MRPDAVVVAAASISPMSIEPESPMKIRAGLKLCGRKPRHAPASTTASSAGEYAPGSLPLACTRPIANSAVADAAISPIPAASPSSPSTKFIALISATVSTTVSSTPWVSPRIRNEPEIPVPPPPHGIQNVTHCTPASTSTPAAVVWPASLVIASSSKRSSSTPTTPSTTTATSAPTTSSE